MLKRSLVRSLIFMLTAFIVVAGFSLTVSAATHTVQFSESEGGSISVKVGEAEIKSGDNIEKDAKVTVTAAPKTDYKLTSIKVGDESLDFNSNYQATFTMPDKDVLITAEFAIDGSHLVLSSTEGGSIWAEVRSGRGEIPGHASYYYMKTSMTIHAKPNKGYKLKNVIVTARGPEDKYAPIDTEDFTFYLDADEFNMHAVFEPVKEGEVLTVKGSGEGGIVKITTGGVVYTGSAVVDPGQEVTIEMIADDDHYVYGSSWDGVHPKRISPTTFTFAMPTGNVTIDCFFNEKVKPEIKIAGGHAKATTDKVRYLPGDTVKLKVKADSGYEVRLVHIIYHDYTTGHNTGQKLTASDDGTYSFTMPKGELTIYIRIMEKQSSGSSSGSSYASTGSTSVRSFAYENNNDNYDDLHPNIVAAQIKGQSMTDYYGDYLDSQKTYWANR